MAGIDLKDLRIFDEVYRSRNVSQAAARVGLSQPSISIRLGRLRRYFNDPLFVRTSGGMQPTPHADTLLESVRRALDLFDGSLGQPASFDPASSERTFRVCMTDVGQIVILPRLLNHIKAVAPAIRIEVSHLNADTPGLLESGDADLAMGFTLEMRAGYFRQKLFEEKFVCMVNSNHPRIGARLSRRQFLAESHVAAATPGTGHWILDKSLEDQGIRRRTTVRVPSFLGLAQIVADTELLVLVPIHLGRILAREGNVKILPAPVKLPAYPVRQFWHQRYHRDAGNKWLRGVVAGLFIE
jgi:DNA-binding transcriptional LysR family regulator